MVDTLQLRISSPHSLSRTIFQFKKKREPFGSLFLFKGSKTSNLSAAQVASSVRQFKAGKSKLTSVSAFPQR